MTTRTEEWPPPPHPPQPVQWQGIDRVEQLYYLDHSTIVDMPRYRLELIARRGRTLEGVRR